MIAEVKQRWSVIRWVTKNLLSRAHSCFGRQFKSLVPAAFAVVRTHQSAQGRVVSYGPFFLCVIYREGMCPSSGDINRLMMIPEREAEVSQKFNIWVRHYGGDGLTTSSTLFLVIFSKLWGCLNIFCHTPSGIYIRMVLYVYILHIDTYKEEHSISFLKTLQERILKQCCKLWSSSSLSSSSSSLVHYSPLLDVGLSNFLPSRSILDYSHLAHVNYNAA
jgi:hypothetical protein